MDTDVHCPPHIDVLRGVLAVLAHVNEVGEIVARIVLVEAFQVPASAAIETFAVAHHSNALVHLVSVAQAGCTPGDRITLLLVGELAIEEQMVGHKFVLGTSAVEAVEHVPQASMASNLSLSQAQKDRQ